MTADPADTAPGSFDGSANVSIGVAPLLTDGTAASTLPTAGTATALTALLNTIRNCLKWLVARFDTAGNANTANKLTSSRTILTNLGSTSAADFDGSANVTPGVTGTLPLGNVGFSTDQSNALNSGITSDKVAIYNSALADIGNKIDKITEIQAVGYKATEATAKSSSLTSTDTLFFYPEP
jgi:hypothetical protein